MTHPLRIRAYLLDGRVVATERYFPLDSILAAEWVRRKLGDDFYNPPPPGCAENWVEAELPFERRGEGDKWYWACSFNQSKPLKEYVFYWNKRFDAKEEKYIDFQGRRGNINPRSGKYKAYRMPINIMLFDYLEWYAVGDKEVLENLCSGVTHIGKKGSFGLGIVRKWEVIPWQEDWSEVGPDQKLMRALYDLPEGTAGIPRQYGMRPPYWRMENKLVVYIPCPD